MFSISLIVVKLHYSVNFIRLYNLPMHDKQPILSGYYDPRQRGIRWRGLGTPRGNTRRMFVFAIAWLIFVGVFNNVFVITGIFTGLL
jgi:hypothetical protein